MFNDSTSQQVFLFLLTRCLFVGWVLCVCVFSDAARYVPTFSCLFCGIVGTLRAASAHIAGGRVFYHTIPCAIMALATFMNPATFAPFT